MLGLGLGTDGWAEVRFLDTDDHGQGTRAGRIGGQKNLPPAPVGTAGC